LLIRATVDRLRPLIPAGATMACQESGGMPG